MNLADRQMPGSIQMNVRTAVWLKGDQNTKNTAKKICRSKK